MLKQQTKWNNNNDKDRKKMFYKLIRTVKLYKHLINNLPTAYYKSELDKKSHNSLDIKGVSYYT